MGSADVKRDRRPELGEPETVNWFAVGLGGGDGRSLTFSGKLSLALLPRNLRAASS